MAGPSKIRDEHFLICLKEFENLQEKLDNIEDKINEFYQISPFIVQCKFIRQKVDTQSLLDKAAWNNLMNIIQQIFKTGKVPKHLAETYMVLIPKRSSKGSRGIGIVNTLWKIVAYIIKRRLQKIIHFHPCVHIFV